MYFFVDESGQTGNNLFDEAQPYLYYGVLSCDLNVDVLSIKQITSMRRRLGVDRLHASELGNEKLASLIPDLIALHRKFNFNFDFYKINKADYAVISFFDQVFDQGMNPAVPWTGYWTPLRYILLIKLASLFDESLRKKAWEARICRENKLAESRLISICVELKQKIQHIPDERSRQIIFEALTWAESNPSAIGYNIISKNDALQISPNLIGFQFVLHGISNRLKKKRKQQVSIIVDRQEQYNPAQEKISDTYKSLREIPFELGPGMPMMDLKHIPNSPISFLPGTSSIGLELVDIFIWIFKRWDEKKYLDPDLHWVLESQGQRGLYDEIALSRIEERWGPFFDSLQDPDEDQLERVQELLALQEMNRQERLTQGG